MARGTSAEILDALRNSHARFYHAINLRDFMSYAQEDRLLSRSELLLRGALTPFASDASDQAKGLFDHHFGNLSDFNGIFWNSFKGTAIPNVYGPITISWRAEALAGCEDLAVSRVNAWKTNYDRASSMSAQDLEDAFEDKNKGWLKRDLAGIEVSFRHPSLPLSTAESVTVEPIKNGVRLLPLVQEAAESLKIRVYERDPREKDEKLWRLKQLIGWADGASTRPPMPLPEPLQEWYATLSVENRNNLERWGKNIDKGTLSILWDHPSNPYVAWAEQFEP